MIFFNIIKLTKLIKPSRLNDQNLNFFFAFFENSSITLTFFFFVFRKSYPSSQRTVGHHYRFIRVTFVKKNLIDFFFHFQLSIFG